MLDFPSTPQVGDTLTGPSGQVWKWDGVKWTAVGGAGGDGGGGWPAMGVTDGSNAAPGEVGEYLEASASNVTSPAGQANGVTVAVLTLPAGDWEVSGFAAAYIPYTGSPLATGNEWQVSLSRDGSGQVNTMLSWPAIYTSTSLYNRMMTAPARFSLSSPSSIGTNINSSNLAGPGGVTGTMTVMSATTRARRMR